MKNRFIASALVLFSILFIAVALGPVSAALPGKAIPSNPEGGLSDQQIEALHSAERQQFENRYAKWVSSLDTSTLNWATLRHGEMTGLVQPPPQSLADAIAKASVVVVGTVTRIKPDPKPYGTTVSLHVERLVKGSAGSDIEVWQASHLEPTLDWAGAVIVDAPWGPLLLPGDRAVLLLNSATQPGKWVAEEFTGTYLVHDGKVRSLSGNPFATSVDGLDESSFVSRIAAGS